MKNVFMRQLEDYTLLARMNEDNFKIYEYVVAYCYDEKSDSWAQGHYFKRVADAIKFMNFRKQNLIDARASLVESMTEYLRTKVDDENAYMSWIYLIPDEATKEDFVDIASDDELWIDCCKKFGELVKTYDEK